MAADPKKKGEELTDTGIEQSAHRILEALISSGNVHLTEQNDIDKNIKKAFAIAEAFAAYKK